MAPLILLPHSVVPCEDIMVSRVLQVQLAMEQVRHARGPTSSVLIRMRQSPASRESTIAGQLFYRSDDILVYFVSAIAYEVSVFDGACLFARLRERLQNCRPVDFESTSR